MARESMGPLLRGIGSTIILLGAIIGFVVARQEVRVLRKHRQGQNQVALSGKILPGDSKNSEDVNGEISDESLADRLVENRWFELLGFIGAAVVTSSFYAEHFSRRNSST